MPPRNQRVGCSALDDSAWSQASVRAEEIRPLEGQVTDPVRQVDELKSKKLTEPSQAVMCSIWARTWWE